MKTNQTTSSVALKPYHFRTVIRCGDRVRSVGYNLTEEQFNDLEVGGVIELFLKMGIQVHEQFLGD